MGGLVIPSCQSQIQVIGGTSVGITSSICSVANSGSVANGMSSGMPTIMTGSSGAGMVSSNTLPTVGSLPSFTQLLTPPTQVTSSVMVHGPSVTAKTKPLHIQQTASKLTQVTSKNQTGADISRVAQNTHLLQALHLPASDKPSSAASGQSHLTSLLSGQQATSSNSGEQSGVPLQVSVADGGPMLAVVSVGGVMSLPEGVVSTGTTFSSPAPLSILVPSQASQVPQSSAVIASSSVTNSVVSGAIISHKQFVSNSALIPQTNVTYTNTETMPMSRSHSQIVNSLQQENVPSQTNNTNSFITKNTEINNKTLSYQNEYVATVQRGRNIIDTSKNKSKSNKKKKKDKEIESVSTNATGTVMVKQSLQERLKSGTCTSISGTIQQQLPLAPIPNGLSGSAIRTASQSIGSSASTGSLPMSVGEMGSHSDNTSLVGSNISAASSVSIMPSIITTAIPTIQASSTVATATLTSTTTSHQTPSGIGFAGTKQPFKQVKHVILSPQNQEVRLIV